MSGTQVSSFAPANVLYDAASGTTLINNQNALLQGQREQQQIGAADVEMTARFAQTLTGMSEEDAARAYGPGIAYLQSLGFAKRAPPTFPGLEVARRLAALGVPAKDQYDQAGVATSATNWRGQPGAPGGGGTAGGASYAGGTATAPARPGGGSATRGELEGGPPAAGTPGAAVAQRVHDFWRSKGLEEHQVAGVLAGGPGSESNFDPTVLGDKGTSMGLYQHHGPRWEMMKQRTGNPNPTEAQQNEFAYWEITEGPLRGIMDKLRAAKTPAEAATIWTRDFGRPGDLTEIDRRARGAGRYHGIYATPGAPGGGGAPPPGVQMGGAPPGPPGGAPGPYGGGGFGTALNPTAPTAPVARTPPPTGGGTASNDLGGDVNAMLAGITRAQTTPMGGVMAAGPAAPTEQRQVSSVEPPPQPGWGTAVGSYGDGAAAPVAPPATTPPPGATQPPAATTPPPAAAMPPALRLNERNLTAADEAEFDYRGPRVKGKEALQQFFNDIEQRKAANLRRQEHLEAQQTAAQNAAAAAAQRDLENRRNAAHDQIAADERAYKRAQDQKKEAADAAAERRAADNAAREAQAATGKQDKQTFEMANTLRDEFGNQTAGFRATQTSYENIRSAAKDGDGASDMALIYNYVRLLDPSVVHESEFAKAAAAGGAAQQLIGAIQRVVDGAILTPSVRAQFVREGNKIYTNALRAHNTTADQYERLAKRFGIDPAMVVTRFDRPQDDTPAAPPHPPGFNVVIP